MSRSRFVVDEHVPGTPDEVADRLVRALLPIRHVWFASLNELRAWDRSTAPLYVRRLDRHRLEVGPRLTNVQAARFAPVVHLELGVEDGGTRMRGAVRMPRFAAGLLGLWTVVVVVWLGFGLAQGGEGEGGWGWVLWWALLVAAVVTAAGLGWVQGGKALASGLPRLTEVAGDPEAGADDWA